jgi:hypothetical protein
MATQTNVPQLKQRSKLAVIPKTSGRQSIKVLIRICVPEVVQSLESLRAGWRQAVEQSL